MNWVKKILFKTLGTKKYLKLISRIYIKQIEKGKYQDKYPELHFLRTFIKPDFYCIDIGANLGYYSYFLCKYAYQGKVWGVEPVPVFAEVLLSNCKFAHFTLVPYALGEKNSPIYMQTPIIDGIFRHGLTKVVDTNAPSSLYSYQVEMKIPNQIFNNLPRLDFVKCDVEGYEYLIFQNFMEVITQHLPILQIEIQNAQKQNMYNLLCKAGYFPYKLQNKNWVNLSYTEYLNYGRDVYFIVPQKIS
ncbi:MAG: FkbM family methyltransferase [Bacteroidia bacterium]|nr:FkbM family methyltransferase [Bacteroidia bacterium]MDW8301825.1 FkbM family methyltransferase [Bacteroidia bacterium]